MAKRTKSFELEKGEITDLRRLRKSQRENLKVLGCNKTYLQLLEKSK